jgi:hypothetical protein
MSRISRLFSRRRLYGDLSAEMEEHLGEKVDELVAEGMSREEARQKALREFGNVTLLEESGREVWQWPSLESFFADVRFAARMLRKSPGFTAVVVLTLALGIGANTTIFSWVRSVLLNPLPGVGGAERVVALETVAPNADSVTTSYLDFRDLRDRSKLVESMSVAKPVELAVGSDNGVERVWGEAVSGNFFDLLRVTPELGRFFSSTEVDREQNAHALAIISYSYWTSHYHADPGAIGATLRINHFPYTVIGVAPEAFHGSMPGISWEM